MNRSRAAWSFRPALAVYVCVLLAFALRIYRLDFQSLWSDEGYTLDIAREGLETILARVSTTDIHPPLYYLLLHFWELIAGLSEFAVRYFSVIPAVLCIPFLFAIGRRLFGSRAGVFAAFIGIATPFAIVYSQEIRMYALVMLLSVGSTYFFICMLNDSSRRITAGYLLISVLALYTHYYSVWVLGAENLVVLVLLARRSLDLSFLRRWIALQVSIALVYLPWLPVLLTVGGWWRNAWVPKPSLTEMVRQTWLAFNTGLMVDAPSSILSFGMVLVWVIGLMAWIRRPTRTTTGILMITAYLLVPILGAIAMAQQRAIFSPKHIIVALPAYVLALAFLVDRVADWNRGLAVFSLILIFAPFVGGINDYFFDVDFWKTDIRAAVRYIQSNEQPGDAIATDDPTTFNYYYRGTAPVMQLPLEYPVVEEQTTARLNEIAATHSGRQLFLMQWASVERDPRGFVGFVLDKSAAKIAEAEFHGGVVSTYRLPAGTGFSFAESALRVDANFADQMKLFQAAYGTSDKGIWVSLQWQLPHTVNAQYKSSVFVRDAAGHTIGQVDNLLFNNLHLSTDRWAPDETAWDNMIVPLTPGAPPGEYTVEVGVYDAANLKRLSVRARDPVRENLITLGTLKLAPPRQTTAVQLLTPTIRRNETVVLLQLRGMDIDQREYAPGESLPLTLYWYAPGAVTSDYTIAFRLGDRTLGTQPLLRAYPTSAWRPGEAFFNWYDLVIPPEIENGTAPLVLEVRNRDQVVQSKQLAEIAISGRAHNFERPAMAHSLDLGFGERIKLIGYDLKTDAPMRAGDTIRLKLYWQALGATDKSYTVFVHLLDAQNQVASQLDTMPLAGSAPTTSWLANEIIADEYPIEIKPDAPDGEYTLEIGMYDASTGARLKIIGDPEANDRLLLLDKVRVE